MGRSDGGTGDCEQSKNIDTRKKYKSNKNLGLLIQSSKSSKICNPPNGVLDWRWRTGTYYENKETCGREQVSLCLFMKMVNPIYKSQSPNPDKPN